MCFLCLDVNGIRNVLAAPCAKRTCGFISICFLEVKWAAWPLPSSIQFTTIKENPYHILASVNTYINKDQLALSCLPLFLPLQCCSQTSVEVQLGTLNFKIQTYYFSDTSHYSCTMLYLKQLFSTSLKVLTKNSQSLSQSFLLVLIQVLILSALRPQWPI